MDLSKIFEIIDTTAIIAWLTHFFNMIYSMLDQFKGDTADLSGDERIDE